MFFSGEMMIEKLLSLIGGCFSNTVGCVILVLIFNLTLGYLSVQYLLITFIGSAAPWVAALLGGLVLGQITVPAALAVWLVQLAGYSF